MFKKFFLNFLSSFVGAWVALGLFCVALAILIFSLIGKAGMSALENAETVKSNTVLTLDLSGEIVERDQRPDLSPMKLLNGDLEVPMSLSGLISAVRKAATDKNVRMIYLKCNGVAAAPATLHALRDELLEFKKSNKKIYAYSDGMGLGDYYVASVADSVFLNPAGSLYVHGMGTAALYFKGLLDKIGVQMQVVKVGTFKSAVEPYISNEMSAPARAQLDTLYGNMWSFISDEICRSRKITQAQFDTVVSRDVLMLQEASFAVEKHLVDKAVYERTMDLRIADALGVEKKKVNFVGPSALGADAPFGVSYDSSSQIAVLYATGEISESTKTGINCSILVPVITDLADNDKVKGLVLRVNSPGGSVFGSDLIGEALNYFKSKGKPFAVSMGDYAASGGYWISCQADRIFADPMTVTGSIGIFGMIPNASALAQRVGVTPQFVSTNPEVDFPSLLRPMTESQLAEMQKMIERGYDKFVGRVAKGRKISDARVRQIAEGRVWDGAKALELKLVDEMGSLQTAIDWVQNKVADGGSKNCEVVAYPRLDNDFWAIVSQSLQQGVSDGIRQTLMKEAVELVPEAEYAEEVKMIFLRRPVQARMMPVKVNM